MPLLPITTDVWGVDDDLWMPGGMHFPVRMTVLRLPDGGLWLHSPVPIDDALAAGIEALGPVRHLVAPSTLHHLWFADAAARWPEATRWAAPGLPAKRPDLSFHHVLGAHPAPWDDVIDQVHIAGCPWASEVVFGHRPSGTWLVTDLVFHIHQAPSWQARCTFRMVGTWKRLAQSRVWRMQTKDRAAAGAACRVMLAWDCDRLVPCHGDVIDQGAKARLTQALHWMLAA